MSKTEKTTLKLKILASVISAALCVIFIAAYFVFAQPVNLHSGKKSGFDFSSDVVFTAGNSDYVTELNVAHSGDLKILCITDVQVNNLSKGNAKKVLDKLVSETNPDIIIHNGDLAHCANQLSCYVWFRNLMDNYKIPWAFVMGNHDTQGNYDGEALMDTMLVSDYCLNVKGADNLNGVTNSNIVIKQNGENVLSLCLLDTHDCVGVVETETKYSYDGMQSGDYGYLTAEQIEFYSWSMKGIESVYGKMDNLTFFHIPLTDFKVAYDLYLSGDESVSYITGERRENECSPNYDSGLFDAVVESKVTKGIFCGHDHVNNYIVNYNDIMLGYVLKTGNCSYDDEDLCGGTLITVTEEGVITPTHIYIK